MENMKSKGLKEKLSQTHKLGFIPRSSKPDDLLFGLYPIKIPKFILPKPQFIYHFNNWMIQ